MGNFEFSHWDDRSRDKLVMICEEWEEGRVPADFVKGDGEDFYLTFFVSFVVVKEFVERVFVDKGICII